VRTEPRSLSAPSTAPTTAPMIRPLFRCWSQVIVPDDPALLFPRANNSPTDEFTCWGDGRLHFRRASDAALSVVLKPQFSAGDLQTLMRARAQNRADSADHLMTAAKFAKQERESMSKVIATNSSCYSVAIRLRIGQRESYELAIREMGDSGETGRISRLVW
jgi:hypothetical protein